MAAITYKCPNCGGELVFDPDLAKYKCPFCNSIFTQEELDRLKPSSAKEQKAEEDTQENSRSGYVGSFFPPWQRGSGDLYLSQLRCPDCHGRYNSGYFLLLLP